MYPFVHFVLSIVPSILVMIVYGWVGIFFWIGAFFVDIDHYIWYVIRKKDISLKMAYIYGKDKSHKESYLHIFHTVEFWILVIIGAIYSNFFCIILFGLAYHILIDLVDMINENLYFKRNFFYFLWLRDHLNQNH